jgi:hypothetical protein
MKIFPNFFNRILISLRILFIIAAMFASTIGLAQEQAARIDTTVLPKLEIPEITIVGKKAITLPFARKGEIYDYTLYEAPLPDSSLIEERTGSSLPLGTLPRYDESFVPFHLSAEGSFGSFANGIAGIYADYKKGNWGLFGNGFFKTTNGHVNNAWVRSVDFNFKAHSLVKTDNVILGSFRTIGGLNIYHDSYGLFGVKTSSVDRSRTSVNFSADLHSIEREINSLDVNLSTVVWSVKDIYPGKEYSSSTVSPKFSATHAVKIGKTRMVTQLNYQSSSLNYNYPVQTPSLINLLLNAQWNLDTAWRVEVGGSLGQANLADGGSRTLIRPCASVRWQMDKDRQWTFWFKPEISFQPYDEQMRINPYFMRQIVANPEQKSVNLGSSFWYNSEYYTIEVNGTATIHSGMPVQVAKLEMIDLEYVNAEQFVLDAQGTLNSFNDLQLSLSGVIQPSFEKGKHTQLPMIPLVKFGAKGEMSFSSSVTAWSSIEFWSKQNGTLDGLTELKERILLNVGVATMLIPRTYLSFELSNILNRRYEWWSGYKAPGISFLLNAKVYIR